MFGLKLANFNNNLYDYISVVSKRMRLHAEKWMGRAEPLLAGHGHNAAQQLNSLRGKSVSAVEAANSMRTFACSSSSLVLVKTTEPKSASRAASTPWMQWSNSYTQSSRMILKPKQLWLRLLPLLSQQVQSCKSYRKPQQQTTKWAKGRSSAKIQRQGGHCNRGFKSSTVNSNSGFTSGQFQS